MIYKVLKKGQLIVDTITGEIYSVSRPHQVLVLDGNIYVRPIDSWHEEIIRYEKVGKNDDKRYQLK